jgi:amino acid transporter
VPEAAPAKLGTLSTLSIGIGGMVGGGIFAVTGLTIEVTKGAAPEAFLIAGLVALLTSYSYLKLTLAFPGEGGTVDFINRAFGGGVLTGTINNCSCSRSTPMRSAAMAPTCSPKHHSPSGGTS